ncbi:MAG TPA: class II glutamine amidotransferase [Pirellulales bacterium]|nr:class II glutamine amidotransferase [Pirellulales bacterium]
MPAADLLLEARNNLRSQACCDARGYDHGDGWGIGWYERPMLEPHVVRSPADARTDQAFEAAARQVAAPIWFAHVRNASVGLRIAENCHPFAYGPWLFAHNGTVTNFEQVGPTLERQIDPALLAHRRGTTDSELVFFLLLEHLRRTGAALDAPVGDPARMATIMGDVLRQLARLTEGHRYEGEPAKFNFLLSDGVALVASRWKHDLHWRAEDEQVTIASEPIGDDSAESTPWREVPDGDMLTVDEHCRCVLHPV